MLANVKTRNVEEINLPDEILAGVFELPTHNVAPLVQPQRQVPVTSDPLREVRVHDSLGCRANGDGFCEFRLSGPRHPGNFGGETLDVVLFPLERSCRNKHGEIAVLDTELLDLSAEKVCQGER